MSDSQYSAHLNQNVPQRQLPNLLIVDDLEANLLFLNHLIQKLPVNVILARSGAEALIKTESVELALAIIDVRMPEMSGYELAEKMKEQRSGHKVPIIFITANRINEIQLFEGYGYGAIDYISKPINNHILLSKITVFLELFAQKQTIISDARVVAMMKESAEELARVNAELESSREKYRILIENNHEIVFTLTEEGMVTFVSPIWTLLLGHPVDQVIGQSLGNFIHPDDKEHCKKWLREIITNGQQREYIDYRVQHINGTWCWHTTSGIPYHDESNQSIVFYGIARDLTEHRQAEEERIALEQMHQLATYTDKARENERLNIARELHDDLGQALTAVKIDLGIIKKNVADLETALKIEKVTHLVSDTIKTIQRLTSQLRPAIIDDLGLEAAIEWYSDEFEKRYDIKVAKQVESGITMAKDASLHVFRIMQESLTNVARHSGASKVNINLYRHDGGVHFEIIDNGIGISESHIVAQNSFGIIGMQERAASMGGTFKISSKKGQGTRISLIFPMNIQVTYENSPL